MLCYRPSMAESNLVSQLERFVTNDGHRQSLRDGTTKQMRHTTKNSKGFNDVSRFTWSTVQPEASELPPQRQLALAEATRYSSKGRADQQIWRYAIESPADCIGGPKTSFKTYSKRKDRA